MFCNLDFSGPHTRLLNTHLRFCNLLPVADNLPDEVHIIDNCDVQSAKVRKCTLTHITAIYDVVHYMHLELHGYKRWCVSFETDHILLMRGQHYNAITDALDHKLTSWL